MICTEKTSVVNSCSSVCHFLLHAVKKKKRKKKTERRYNYYGIKAVLKNFQYFASKVNIIEDQQLTKKAIYK